MSDVTKEESNIVCEECKKCYYNIFEHMCLGNDKPCFQLLYCCDDETGE